MTWSVVELVKVLRHPRGGMTRHDHENLMRDAADMIEAVDAANIESKRQRDSFELELRATLVELDEALDLVGRYHAEADTYDARLAAVLDLCDSHECTDFEELIRAAASGKRQ